MPFNYELRHSELWLKLSIKKDWHSVIQQLIRMVIIERWWMYAMWVIYFLFNYNLHCRMSAAIHDFNRAQKQLIQEKISFESARLGINLLSRQSKIIGHRSWISRWSKDWKSSPLNHRYHYAHWVKNKLTWKGALLFSRHQWDSLRNIDLGKVSLT